MEKAASNTVARSNSSAVCTPPLPPWPLQLYPLLAASALAGIVKLIWTTIKCRSRCKNLVLDNHLKPKDPGSRRDFDFEQVRYIKSESFSASLKTIHN